jgi:hypothetical protein
MMAKSHTAKTSSLRSEQQFRQEAELELAPMEHPGQRRRPRRAGLLSRLSKGRRRRYQKLRRSRAGEPLSQCVLCSSLSRTY